MRTNYQPNIIPNGNQNQTSNHKSSQEPNPISPLHSTIDMNVFQQLLAMEEDEDEELSGESSFGFTKGLVEIYFEDGQLTLDQMNFAL